MNPLNRILEDIEISSDEESIEFGSGNVYNPTTVETFEINEEDDVIEISSPVFTEPEIDFSSNVIDMTGIGLGEEHKVISMTDKKEFDPNSTQNALYDDDDEGGVYRSRSTSNSLNSSNQGGTYKGKTVKVEEGKIELSGFKVVINYGNGDQGIDVRAVFNDVETAKASINGDKFIFFDVGGMKVGTIVSGAPIISNDDREISKFINGVWVRS